jgi:hypothetical protein
MAAHLATHVYDPTHTPGVFGWALVSDVYLTLWIPAWDVHALTTAPATLFDANILHPAPRTLALAEHMLGMLPLYAPVALMSHDPVLAHQTTLVLTFACAFLAAFALVEDWTGCWAAAFVAGALFALSPGRVAGLAGLQVESDFYLPLIPLCARRALVGRPWRWAILLPAVLVLQSLASLYLAYGAFVAVALLMSVAVVCDPGTRRYAIPVVASVAAAGAAVVVATLPYLSASRSGAIVAPTREFLRLASPPLLATGATPALLLALATAGFWCRGLRIGVHRGWVAGLAAVAVVGHALAVGPQVEVGGWTVAGPYALLARVVPGFAAVRNPGRLNALTSLGLSALAGVGVAGALRWCGTGLWARVGTATAMTLAGLAVVYVVPTPHPLMRIETARTLPGAYTWLATAPAGPLVEIPYWDAERYAFHQRTEARRMYLSTYHWHPILNGYSGHVPPTYPVVTALVRALPDRRATELLARVTGLRYVLVHRDELASRQRQRWREAWRQFELVGVFGGDVLLQLRAPPAPDLLPALRDAAPSGTTLLGTRLQPLPPRGRQAELSFASSPPRALLSGVAVDLEVEVKNVSSVTWPALTVSRDHAVTFAYRWEDQNGRVLSENSSAGGLPYDLAPHDSVRMPVAVEASGVKGRLRLVLGLAQDGRWLDGSLPPVAVEVVTP